MTVEGVIELLMGLIGPENAEEGNEALGKAAKILQLIADNKHLHIHRMRRRWRRRTAERGFAGGGGVSGQRFTQQ